MHSASPPHKGMSFTRFHGFAVLFRLVDMVIVPFSLLLAQAVAGRQLDDPLLASILAIAGFSFFAESLSLYRSWRSTRLMKLLATNFAAWFLAGLFVLTCSYLVPARLSIDSEILILWAVVGLLVFGTFRILGRQLIFSLRRRGYNTQTAAILGVTRSGLAMARSLEENPQLGIRLIGFFDDREPGRFDGIGERQPVLLGNIDQAIKLARSNAVDVLYIAMPMRAEERITEILMMCGDSTASVHIIPDFFVYNLLYARWHEVGEVQSLSVYDSPLDDLTSWVKRVEDILLATVILTIVALPMLVIALVIKLTSAGPVLFKQHRYGLDGRKIEVWKFRSMTSQDNGPVVQQAVRNDPRVTRFGAFLRRTSLDELPQFFNVLAGQMSVVGPRPHAVAHNEEYRALINGYMLRHHMKPGITGWAQINGWRGETDTLEKMQKRLEFDLAYIRNWSVWLDIKIVIRTVFQGFTSSNAY
ncbi:undecaprenyl-phosphate glucose phosphotransferase [Ferrimonas sediminicola]|uniref:Undecaprenyl-phosphate glucose phosphotransferase n=1 Tax=Ferrimonas sediminicola TaxID=2569538 RepID=A0A4U1BE18_9GAMM|nr:undecaprenyl-phosphate glucose phosphotransferase [Ferrimonas sediminicola]TKB48196.1 undecaprenyl-phosphate glucose phosphotransferase [Ferrimonas sediminicola]